MIYTIEEQDFILILFNNKIKKLFQFQCVKLCIGMYKNCN